MPVRSRVKYRGRKPFSEGRVDLSPKSVDWYPLFDNHLVFQVLKYPDGFIVLNNMLSGAPCPGYDGQIRHRYFSANGPNASNFAEYYEEDSIGDRARRCIEGHRALDKGLFDIVGAKEKKEDAMSYVSRIAYDLGTNMVNLWQAFLRDLSFDLDTITFGRCRFLQPLHMKLQGDVNDQTNESSRNHERLSAVCQEDLSSHSAKSEIARLNHDIDYDLGLVHRLATEHALFVEYNEFFSYFGIDTLVLGQRVKTNIKMGMRYYEDIFTHQKTSRDLMRNIAMRYAVDVISYAQRLHNRVRHEPTKQLVAERFLKEFDLDGVVQGLCLRGEPLNGKLVVSRILEQDIRLFGRLYDVHSDSIERHFGRRAPILDFESRYDSARHCTDLDFVLRAIDDPEELARRVGFDDHFGRAMGDLRNRAYSFYLDHMCNGRANLAQHVNVGNISNWLTARESGLVDYVVKSDSELRGGLITIAQSEPERAVLVMGFCDDYDRVRARIERINSMQQCVPTVREIVEERNYGFMERFSELLDEAEIYAQRKQTYSQLQVRGDRGTNVELQFILEDDKQFENMSNALRAAQSHRGGEFYSSFIHDLYNASPRRRLQLARDCIDDVARVMDRYTTRPEQTVEVAEEVVFPPTVIKRVILYGGKPGGKREYRRAWGRDLRARKLQIKDHKEAKKVDGPGADDTLHVYITEKMGHAGWNHLRSIGADPIKCPTMGADTVKKAILEHYHGGNRQN